MIKQLWHKLTGLELDSSISTITICAYICQKLINAIRGFLLFGKIKIFVDKNCSFNCKSKIFSNLYLNIQHDVHIDALSKNGVHFGSHVSIGCFTRIECTGSLSHLGNGFECGNHCGLGTNAFYGAAGGIKIGNNVIIGNFVSMHSENHNFSDTEIPIRLQGTNHKGIVIGDNCWIGAKVTILDGVHLGNGCVVAAGAVVTKDFPDNVVIAGVPAKIIKYRL